MENNRWPHVIENHLGEKLIITGSVHEDGEEKLIVENEVQPGAGPAMHVHFKQDECLTVSTGKLGYQILGKEPVFISEGESILFERGVPHRFWNAGEGVLRCTGWVKPANSFVFFLTAIYNAINKSGKAEPEPFDGAYLLVRYRSEYDMPEIPVFVKRVIMPITVVLGRLLGKYSHFSNAPEPLR